jgi:hypothetical protein
MDNFIESFDDYKRSKTVTLAEKEADDNTKIKDLMDAAKEAKAKAVEAKEEYDNHVKAKAKEGVIEISLLKYKKFKAEAELKSTEAKLLKKGASDE